MIRGTTPTHIFTIPFDTDSVKEILLTYAQNTYTKKENVLFEKTTADCVLDGNQIRVELTQEETFMFECKSIAQVQLRILTKAGKALASDVLKIPVETCLSKVVLE